MRILITFFVIAYLISWIIWLPLYLPLWGITNLPVVPFHHALGALGPMIAAFITVATVQGRKGLKALLRSMVTSGNRLLLMVSLLGPFLLLIFALLIDHFISHVPISFQGIGETQEFPEFNLAVYFLYNLVFFGFGEEVGWKGVALPILQKRFSAFTSATVFTAFWAIWHWPLFLYRTGYTTMELTGVMGWLFSLLTGRILLTWLFNSSAGSILVCAIFHAMIDIVFVSQITSESIVNYMGMLITFCGIVAVFAYGHTNLSKNRRVTGPW